MARGKLFKCLSVQFLANVDANRQLRNEMIIRGRENPIAEVDVRDSRVIEMERNRSLQRPPRGSPGVSVDPDHFLLTNYRTIIPNLITASFTTHGTTRNNGPRQKPIA